MELSIAARLTLYPILTLMGLFCVLVLIWQIRVMRGKAMPNPDGSADDWHEQKTHYGIAVADIFVAVPTNILGIILVFIAPRWGYYLVALASFWWVWASVMTTATSLRFEKPKITVVWFITFPLGIILGLAYIVWSVVQFEVIY